MSNRLDPAALGAKRIAGVIGDAPSVYSKSPRLWNAAFQELQLDAAYVPLDVAEAALPRLIRVIRDSPRFLGVNVTVPYKIAVLSHLDESDDECRRVGAVNTVVRTAEGKLVGHNTDGRGFLASLLETFPGQARPFLPGLAGAEVLLLGAGGAARAVAFALAQEGAKLIISNRTRAAAQSLARAVAQEGASASGIGEDEIDAWARRVDLIVNATVKGQEGWRKMPDNKITSLEPYSALAPANPSGVEGAPEAPEVYRAWLKASRADIEANNRASLELALAIPAEVAFYDLIYAPPETVFLRHGRYSGHRTLNGKRMIVAQAAEAFFHAIAREALQKSGRHTAEVYRRVLEIMLRAW